MKTLKYTDKNAVEWDIEIYYPETKPYAHLYHEMVILKSNGSGISFRYPTIPIGYDFSIEPSTFDSNGNTIEYGKLMCGDEIVTSFDPNN